MIDPLSIQELRDSYDDLKKRVASFQQGESLTPDGIAGEETLVRLAAAGQGGSIPSLTGVRR